MKRRLLRDHCTASPDGFGGVTWTGVCKEHDVDYATHRVSRWCADARLFTGMRRNILRDLDAGWIWKGIGSWVVPSLYWAGVRTFGWYQWRQWTPAKGPLRKRREKQCLTCK